MNPNHTTRIRTSALRLFADGNVGDINVSELAEMAGVARGTIYKNVKSPETLFEDIAAELADEMHRRVTLSMQGIDDPAHRLATGVRMFVRRAHDEPVWTRFILRYSFSNEALKGMLLGPPARDLADGIEGSRYAVDPDQAVSALALIAGTTLSAMLLVREGLKTWRDAGSDAAELILRGLGIDPEEAKKIATSELPPLPKLDDG